MRNPRSSTPKDRIPELLLRDPLAEFLGALGPGETFSYSYDDAVKLSGHSCPTVAGSYLMTVVALQALYPGSIPVRGEIEVTIGGAASESTWGPISQVVAFLTGAAPETGFGGLGGKFRRKHLLRFDPALKGRLQFRRTDTGATVIVRYDPTAVPAPAEMGQLLGEALAEDAPPQVRERFARLWQERVKAILAGDPKQVVTIERKDWAA
ncbi:MAG: FmdE family protein [Bdellovibrionota bacterium]